LLPAFSCCLRCLRAELRHGQRPKLLVLVQARGLGAGASLKGPRGAFKGPRGPFREAPAPKGRLRRRAWLRRDSPPRRQPALHAVPQEGLRVVRPLQSRCRWRRICGTTQSPRNLVVSEQGKVRCSRHEGLARLGQRAARWTRPLRRRRRRRRRRPW